MENIREFEPPKCTNCEKELGFIEVEKGSICSNCEQEEEKDKDDTLKKF